MDKKFTNRIQLHEELDHQTISYAQIVLPCPVTFHKSGMRSMRLGNYLLRHKPDCFDSLK